MNKVIKDLKINYQFNDIKSDTTLVLLHGWGQNIAMMEPISKHYEEYFNTLILDLPGFGLSDEPKTSWSLEEYVEFLKEFFQELKLKKIILVGHSFGGRLALLYASIYPTEKLICLASPYCPEVTKVSTKTKIYKKIKQIPGLKWLANIMRSKMGSTDYKNASEIMRGVLVKAVNSNISEDVKLIKCPTLLIWGDNDTAVPITRAYELRNMIKDSGLVVYNGATHYAYLERISEVVKVLDSFMGVERKWF